MEKISGEINISGITGLDTGQQMTLDALMLAIMADRAELLDGQVRKQVNDVRAKNEILKKTNQMMALARKAKDGNATAAEKGEISLFCAEHGISYGGNWDTNIENLKGFSESMTSTSQLDMAQLQSTMGKYNQTFEQLSNFISKYASSIKSIVGNIR